MSMLFSSGVPVSSFYFTTISLLSSLNTSSLYLLISFNSLILILYASLTYILISSALIDARSLTFYASCLLLSWLDIIVNRLIRDGDYLSCSTFRTSNFVSLRSRLLFLLLSYSWDDAYCRSWFTVLAKSSERDRRCLSSDRVYFILILKR